MNLSKNTLNMLIWQKSSLFLFLFHLQVLLVLLLLSRPFFHQLSSELLVYRLLSLLLYCLIPFFHFLLRFLKCRNAVLVELGVLRVLPEHLCRVHSHLLQFLLLLLSLFLLFLSYCFKLILSLLDQDLLSLKLPHTRLSHLFVLKSHSQVHHCVVSEVIANVKDLLEVWLAVESHFISELGDWVQQSLLDWVGLFFTCLVVDTHRVEWMN